MIFLFGKKKEQEAKRVYIPVDLVQKYASEGLNETQIISRLQSQGFPQEHIDKALRIALAQQVRTGEAEGIPEPREVVAPAGPVPLGEQPLPSRRLPLGYPPERVVSPAAEAAPVYMEAPEASEAKFTFEERGQESYATAEPGEITVEEIIEGIVAERWAELEDRLSVFEKKDLQLQSQIEDLRKRIDEVQSSIQESEKSLIGKFVEFGESMDGIQGRIGSIEKIFKDFLPELSENIRIMSRIIEKTKEERK